VSQLIEFSFYGSSDSAWLNPHILTRSLLAQRILLSIHNKERTPSDIGAQIGVHKDYVVDELSRLSENALVANTNEDLWIANFIILNAEEKKPFVDLARDIASEEVSRIQRELPQLKAVFEKCSVRNQGFTWEQMDYIILAALIADLGVNYSLHRKSMVAPPPERPDGGRWYFWGLERGADSKRQFGVNSNSTKQGGTAHIWSRFLTKPSISPFKPDEMPLMFALANQSLTASELAQITRIEEVAVKLKMKKLSSYGYYSDAEGKFKANFPILSENDLGLIIKEVTRVSNTIVDKVIKPKSVVLRRLFRKMELDRLNREYSAYQCMFYHIIMDHVLDRFVESGILPEMPKKARVTWGFWGWIGELELLSFSKSP